MKKFIIAALPLLSILILPTQALAVFNVGQGGTGQTSFPTGACLLGNGTNPLNATYSPSFASLSATSTTATSTFSGNQWIKGKFVVMQEGETIPSLLVDPINRTLHLQGNSVNLYGDIRIGGSESFVFRDPQNENDWVFMEGLDMGQIGLRSANAAGTTTVTFGQLGSSSSRSCFNTKNTTGDDISFYFVGTAMVVENNVCR